MTMIELFMRQPLAQAIGWALLQFVWQGAVLGMLTAVVLAFLRRSASDIRYVVSTIGLALMLTMPIVTAWQSLESSRTRRAVATAEAKGVAASAMPSAISTRGLASTPATPEGITPGQPAPLADAVSWDPGTIESFVPWMPLVVFMWMCGVLLLSLRLATGWLWVQAMKRHRASPAADTWQHTARKLARQLHIGRPVRLLESGAVGVPTVIGWLRPVVLLPVSALAALSPRQVEAILAHELAHIRRHDYLVNLLQTLVETLLFYHPAVWWLSRRIRAERENCCDDLAVSLCGDPYAYAKALADLEELRGTSGRLALAATGGSLLQRVRRLVGAPSHAGRGPGWAAGIAALLLMTGVAAGAIGNELFLHDRRSVIRSNANPGDNDDRFDQRDAVQAANALHDVRGATRAFAEGAREATRAFVKGAREATRSLAEGAREASRAVAGGARDATRALASESRRLRSSQLRYESVEPIPPVKPRPPQQVGVLQVAVQSETPHSPEWAAVPEASAAPQAPSAPEAPAAPQAPAAPEGPRSDGERSHGNFSWSNAREKVDVRYDGAIEFSDDDTDVKRLSPNGYLKIVDGGWFGGHSVEFRADSSGRIERRFWIGSSERPFEPEGRRWLSDALPRVIRQTGIGASSRVARFLKAGGPSAVLAEISIIEGSWAKRLYFGELLKTASLDASTRARVLSQAGREIDSDFELATLLISSADQLVADDTSRKAYLDAARSISSDFELRRVLSSALKTRVASNPGLLANLLETSQSIGSDFEEATLLIDVVNAESIDGAARVPFFKALGTVESDFEHRRVLSALGKRGNLTDETVRAMLESSIAIGSDFEQATLLTEIGDERQMSGATLDAFFRAVGNIGSSFERSRVLQAVLKRPDVSSDVLVGVLQALTDMKGSFETSQVLQAMASHHRLTGQARDLYIDIAGRLGQFEQGQALTALVRADRTDRK